MIESCRIFLSQLSTIAGYFQITLSVPEQILSLHRQKAFVHLKSQPTSGPILQGTNTSVLKIQHNQYHVATRLFFLILFGTFLLCFIPILVLAWVFPYIFGCYLTVFTVSVVRPKEILDAPSLKMFRASLGGSLSNLV